MSDHGHFTPRPCQNCKDKDAEIERLRRYIEGLRDRIDTKDAEIERMRGERNRQYDQNIELIVQIAKLQAALRYCGGRLDRPRCPRCADRQKVARAALENNDE